MDDNLILDDAVYRPMKVVPATTYKLNIDKIKTLEDVIKIIDGLNI